MCSTAAKAEPDVRLEWIRISPMWLTSNTPTLARTALCSATRPPVDGYSTGISQPPKSTILAPKERCTAFSGVLRSLAATESAKNSSGLASPSSRVLHCPGTSGRGCARTFLPDPRGARLSRSEPACKKLAQPQNVVVFILAGARELTSVRELVADGLCFLNRAARTRTVTRFPDWKRISIGIRSKHISTSRLPATTPYALPGKSLRLIRPLLPSRPSASLP